MLLLAITIPLFRPARFVVPSAKIAFVGKLVPAGPILQKEMVLLSLPFAVVPSLAKKMVPPALSTAIVADPWMLHRVIVLLVAPSSNRIVLVLLLLAVLTFAMVSEFPPVLRPSIVTLSAPTKSISGAPLRLPEMVLAAPPLGWMEMLV